MSFLNNNEITNATFISNKVMTMCTKKSGQILSLQPMQSTLTIPGESFIHLTFNPKFIYAVSNGSTPPFTQTFLQILNNQNGSFIKSMEFSSDILKIMCSSSFVFVSLSNLIHVIDIDTCQIVASIERQCENGMFTVSQNFIAYADDLQPGYVIIASIPGFSVIRKISCHKEKIVCIHISIDEKILTTASKTGTLARTFSLENGEKLNEYRRGFRPSSIICVSSSDSMTLILSLSTLHIFLLPSQHITVPITNPAISCEMINDQTVALVTNDGLLSLYKVDGINNTAQILTQHRLVSSTFLDQSRKRRSSI